MPSSWDALVHPDLGLVSNSRTRLAGDTRPQTPVTIVTSGGIISTTAGSSVITFTTPSAHGFANGNLIGVQLLDPSVTQVGGIDIGTISYLRFAAANVTSTTFKVDLALYEKVQNPLRMVITPLLSNTSFIATSTVSSAGGALRLYKLSTWRDAWLESSVKWVLAHPVSKRNAPPQGVRRPKALIPAPKIHSAPARSIRDVYKRTSLACPTNVTLTPLANIVPTVNITAFAKSSLDPSVAAAHLKSKLGELNQIFTEQLTSGGLCYDAADGNQLKGTPSLTAYGKFTQYTDFTQSAPISTIFATVSKKK
jgi:hypothetical protein